MTHPENSRLSTQERGKFRLNSVQNRFDEYGISILDILWQDLFEPTLRAGVGKLRNIIVYNIESSTFGIPIKGGRSDSFEDNPQ